MINFKKLILASIIFNFTGCELFSGYEKNKTEERIAQHKEMCILIGFSQGSRENALCTFELEKAYLSGLNSYESGGSTANQADVQRMIDQDRVNKQILNHGAGGCTPNFSTGGCL